MMKMPMLNYKSVSWNVIFLLFLSSLSEYITSCYSAGFFVLQNPIYQSLLQGDGRKDKSLFILCTIKAMIQRTGYVDLEFHLVIVNLWFEKGIASYLVEKKILIK